MLARLLLVLLLVVGAAPGSAMPAACHGDPAMTMTAAAPTHHPRRSPSTMAEHGCIGCAALADWLAERVAAPLIAAASAPIASPGRFFAQAPPLPGERPPRIG